MDTDKHKTPARARAREKITAGGKELVVFVVSDSTGQKRVLAATDDPIETVDEWALQAAFNDTAHLAHEFLNSSRPPWKLPAIGTVRHHVTQFELAKFEALQQVASSCLRLPPLAPSVLELLDSCWSQHRAVYDGLPDLKLGQDRLAKAPKLGKTDHIVAESIRNMADSIGAVRASRFLMPDVDNTPSGAVNDQDTEPPQDESNPVMAAELLEAMIEEARRHLDYLVALRDYQPNPSPSSGDDSSTSAEDATVILDTPTGPIEYVLPFSAHESYGAAELSKILSPTDRPHRSLVQSRRKSNELLGVLVGNQYRYPKFQIDTSRKRIDPVVAYVNKVLEAAIDPWGTLDWWYQENEDLHGARPVDLVVDGRLDVNEVERSLARERQGMD